MGASARKLSDCILDLADLMKQGIQKAQLRSRSRSITIWMLLLNATVTISLNPKHVDD
jgi:hypothetical protein